MGTNRYDVAFYFIGFCDLSVWLNYDDHLLRTYADFPVKTKEQKKQESLHRSFLILSVPLVFVEAYFNFIRI